MSNEEKLTIGKLAAKVGVGLETVRYYERRGLLSKPSRSSSGYRLYSPEAVRRVRFVKRAQTLGFSLDEIIELLSLRMNPGTTCADIKTRADRKARAVEEKIQALLRVKEALAKVSSSCQGRGPIGDCPILAALDNDDRGKT